MNEYLNEQQETNNNTSLSPVGYVLGTEEITPTSFWFLVAEGESVALDELVYLKTTGAGGKEITFYGVVDEVIKEHEGLNFHTDMTHVLDGVMPAAVVYRAHVLVMRAQPEQFIPPHPCAPVWLARGKEFDLALSADKMGVAAFPGGLVAGGQVLPLNYNFINGKSGGHINISGISGVATKTSYALFLLHSMFSSGVMDRVGKSSAQSRAIIFNVKGEDLLFLNHPNKDLDEKLKARWEDKDPYAIMGLPKRPFQSIEFLAPARAGGDQHNIIPNTHQGGKEVSAFLFTIAEFCEKRMLPFAFNDIDPNSNLKHVIDNIADRLAKIASGEVDNASSLRVYDWVGKEDEEDNKPLKSAKAIKGYSIETLYELVEYLEYKLITEPDNLWVQNQAQSSLQAFIRRFRAISKHLSPFIRGDIEPEKAIKHRPDPFSNSLFKVIDIHSLNSEAQTFVVGILIKEIFDYKESGKGGGTIFIVLDELNKYAPRQGHSPIKEILLDIAERGRSLGIILIGAQQTASEVEGRIVSNAAVRIVGRLDMAEAQSPEYRFLPASFRERAGILQPGTMMVYQPEVPTPVLVNYPFPAWATRAEEVAVEAKKQKAYDHFLDD